jgi:DNA ligase-1
MRIGIRLKELKLSKLYKKDSKGKIREWSINVDGNSYWTVTGQKDGKMITHLPKYTVGKNVGKSNETTPEEQAVLEAQSHWQKRVDKGYNKNLDLVSQDRADGIFYVPQLAQEYQEIKNWPVYVQPKLDGIRCIVRLENGEIVGRTRNGKVIECMDHIIDQLKECFVEDPELILDGELYNHGLKDDFNKITSLVRKKRSPEALEAAKSLIQYWVFDAPRVYDFDESVRFRTRNFGLISLLEGHCYHYDDGMTNYIVNVQTKSCYNTQTLDEWHNTFLNDGYEGSIVRRNAPYENKRSKNVLKRKEFFDTEYLVLDVVEGIGNRVGTAGNLVCRDEETEKEFHSNIKGTFEYLAELLENKDDYIGKLVTVKYFQLTPDGVPRFPFAIGFRDYE